MTPAADRTVNHAQTMTPTADRTVNHAQTMTPTVDRTVDYAQTMTPTADRTVEHALTKPSTGLTPNPGTTDRQPPLPPEAVRESPCAKPHFRR